MKFKNKQRNGFALVEMLVSLFILVLISFAIGNFQHDIFFFGNSIQSSLSVQLDARKVLRNIITELRSASPSSLGAYPVAQAGTSTLIFYSNIDSDTYKERLHYYMQGSSLMRGVIKPSGSPLTYNSAQEVVTTLAHNVINSTSTPIFDYFDKNYYGTTTPLVQPVNPLSVRLVRVTVIIDSDPNRPPPPITVTSQGTLRNLKDNL
jgi:hypothetical protein